MEIKRLSEEGLSLAKSESFKEPKQQWGYTVDAEFWMFEGQYSLLFKDMFTIETV